MRLIICFLLLFIPGAAIGQQLHEIDQFVSKQLSDQKITSVSIGIIQYGKIVTAKGYGLANVEDKIPASQNTVYKLGSLSKQMVATGIMLLLHEGKISLTDPITRFFKDAPATWHKITIRHLLNHTSGLERESPAFNPSLIQPDTVLIKAAYKDPLVFETGTKWQYCNLGYFILADIIRQASGKSFPQFMQEAVFSKYGLTVTQTTTANEVANKATGYVMAKNGLYSKAQDFLALRPSGAFISSITDVLKWEMLIQRGRLLSKKDWRKMWTDTVKTDANNPKAEYYGYGWRVTHTKGRLMVYHGGTMPGFRSAYYRFPDDNTAIIVLTNTDHANPAAIAEGIADILFSK